MAAKLFTPPSAAGSTALSRRRRRRRSRRGRRSRRAGTRSDRRADRLRQDARRVPRRDRPAGARGVSSAAACRTRPTSFTSRRSRRSRTTSAAISRRRWPASATSSSAGLARCRDPHLRAHRRHAAAANAQSMRRRPPHIVVTTPESLYILLGSESGRAMLATTRTVIVDEIHAMAGSKRGLHLALSLERLEALRRRGRVDGAIGLVRDAEADRGGGAIPRRRPADCAPTGRPTARSSIPAMSASAICRSRCRPRRSKR